MARQRQGMQSSSSAYLTALSVTCALGLMLGSIPSTDAIHHMKRNPGLTSRDNSNNTPLVVTNKCADTIWPGINTQNGDGPSSTGFQLASGDSKNQTVSANWQGRVWARTNCSFSSNGNSGGGKACGTGDCGGALNCQGTGETPVSLAEFTMDGGDGHTYYDISLVDGYNMPVAIVRIDHGNTSLDAIPPSLTNPSCEGTASELADKNFNPYNGNDQTFLGTNSSYPLIFDTQNSMDDVSKWCPWNLQVNPPSKPGDGVYPYPDDNIQRPAFQPCFSACAKWSLQQDCCTGSYNSPSKCQPSEYSKAAKSVCPDAYSYAFDDQTSTFIIPSGAGFEVVFCPGGRSSNILSSNSSQLQQLVQNGHLVSNGTTKTSAAAEGAGLNANTLGLSIVMIVLTACVFTMM